MEFTVQQIADLIGGKVEGDGARLVKSPAKIEEGKEGDLCFLANHKYEAHIYTTDASGVIVSNDLELKSETSATLIRVEDPYLAFTVLLERFSHLLSEPEFDASAPSHIHETADVDESVQIGAFSSVGAGSKVLKNVKIYPGVTIGNHVEIGEGSVIYPGVTIYKDCKVGKQVIIHAGSVIGSDGFGFAPQPDGTYKKIPQLGNVIIGDDVEIGANTVVDRATMGATVVHSGVKLDNLIQVAHNVEIGANTVIAAQTGISGSTKIGENCMFGGQVGVIGHVSIANGTKVNAQSGVTKAVKQENTSLSGTPATDLRKFYKSMSVVYSLSDKMRTLHQLIDEREKQDL